MPSLVNKKPISVTLDSNGNPTTLVEFSDTVSTRHVVPLIHGGTGADTASGARTSLGLGSLSTLSTITVSQLANNIDASGIGFIAYKAEQLETARTINGVSFDGTQDVAFDTDDVSEGSTNEYFTTTRANTAIDARVTKSFIDGLNVDADTLDGISSAGFATAAQGTLADSATQPSDNISTLTNDSAFISLTSLSGTSGVTYNNTTGAISIGQEVATTSNVTFNNLIVSGNLTVSGTTTEVNTETINLADNQIVLNSNATGSASENAGIEVERGDDTNKTLIWNETTDKWTVGSETFVAGTLEGTLNSSTINFEDNTGIIEFAVTVSNPGSGNRYFLDGEETARIQLIPGLTYRFDVSSNTVSGHPFRFSTTSDGTHNSGTNYGTGVTVSGTSGTSGAYVQIVVDASTPDLLYYYCTAHSGMGGTGAISISGTDLGSNTTDNLTEGSTNQYYTNARFDTRFTSKDTDDLSQGTTNKYYATSLFNTDFASKDTGDLSEGSNKYYTDERVDDRVDALLQAGTDISITYDDNANTLTIANTATVNTEDVQDIVGGQIVTNGSHTGISFTYDDSTDGGINATVSLSGFDTDNLSEGSSNLYYTDARVASYLSTNSYATETFVTNAVANENEISEMNDVTITSLATNQVLRYSGSAWVNVTLDTDDIGEGSTNLYYTNARFDTRLATKDTADLSEGTNLYFTNARADARIAAADLENLNNIGFSAPGSPEDGKVVFWDNSSGSFLLSSVGGLAGSGESNTASNVGTAGVGIFKQKSVEDLQFKKLNAGSTKITVTDDTSNDEIDINLGTVLLGDLSNVSSTSPQSNQVLKWDSTAGEWQPENESVSAEDVGVSLGLLLALS